MAPNCPCMHVNASPNARGVVQVRIHRVHTGEVAMGYPGIRHGRKDECLIYGPSLGVKRIYYFLLLYKSEQPPGTSRGQLRRERVICLLVTVVFPMVFRGLFESTVSALAPTFISLSIPSECSR